MPADADIELTYTRYEGLYSGEVWVQVYPTRGKVRELDFSLLPFNRMMAKLAEVVRRFDNATVRLQRGEIPGSSYKLDEGMVALLKTDPAAAIRSMMFEPITVMIRDEQKRISQSLLRVGHDTIAASLGDDVYCAILEDKLECPGCGRWSKFQTISAGCSNSSCGIQLFGKVVGNSWFIVSTELLLELNLPQYYLPRDWNPTKGWISWLDLHTMYETFKEERDQCSQTDPKA